MINHYVLGFAFNKDRNEVALLLKNRPAWQAGLLNGVGGHIEEDESPIIAMDREFVEEACCSLLSAWQEYAIMSRIDANPNFVCHVFKALTSLPTLRGHVQSREDQPIIFCDPAHLPWNLIPNLRWLIPMALDNNESYDYKLEAHLSRSGPPFEKEPR